MRSSAFVLFASPSFAQDPVPQKHLPRWNSFYWLAGAGAAALAIHPADDHTWHGRNFYASPMLLPKGSGVIVSVNLDDRSALRHH